MPKISQERAALSRENIVRAAVELADQSGINAITMRKLALQLNVEAMSLYNHIANKEALLDAMVEQVIADMDIPDVRQDWQQELHRWALSVYRVLKLHPWATLMIISRMNVGPAMLRQIDASLGCLVEAGYSLACADEARTLLSSFLYGFILQEQNFPIQPEAFAEKAQAFLPELPDRQYPYMRSLALEVIEGRFSGVNQLSFGLDLILGSLKMEKRENGNKN